MHQPGLWVAQVQILLQPDLNLTFYLPEKCFEYFSIWEETHSVAFPGPPHEAISSCN